VRVAVVVALAVFVLAEGLARGATSQQNVGSLPSGEGFPNRRWGHRAEISLIESGRSVISFVGLLAALIEVKPGDDFDSGVKKPAGQPPCAAEEIDRSHMGVTRLS